MKKIFLLLALATSFGGYAQVVAIVNGTATSASAPLSYGQPYSANEAVYLAAQIGLSGVITRLAFDKVEGTVVAPIENVVIYLKSSAAPDLPAGALDTTGYQRVFAGNFPNSLTSGYLEVLLRTPFAYSAPANLAVLVLRNGGATNAVTGQQPKFRYGFTTGRNSTRRYTGTAPLTAATVLTVSTALANVRLTFGNATAARTATATAGGRLFPVPAAGTVTLDAGPGPLTYFVTDALGRVVRPVTPLPPVVGDRHQLEFSELRGGIYQVHVGGGAGHQVLRLVRE